MEAVVRLVSCLRTLDALRHERPASVTGPRRWWAAPPGGLDVEGLALGSVAAAATALNALTGRQRSSVEAGRVAAAFDSLGNLRVDGRKPEGFAPMSGFRRTADGWIRLHANYPHHAARLMEALSAAGPGDVDRAVLDMTALDAEAVIAAHGGAAAAVRSREQWRSSPLSAATQGPWISFTPAGHSGARNGWVPDRDAGRPLDGLRVLDLTRVVAGPTATRLLGALGADVLRVDPPGMPELEDAFVDSGFDKRSVKLDLARQQDLQRVRALLDGAEAVITGYRGGSLDRYGLDASALLHDRPGLVVVALTAWGYDGPWTARRGFDSLVQAACGIAERYGQDKAGWQPGALPIQALDHATGYGIAAAVLALLAERRDKGTGGAARLSLARTAEELFVLRPAAGTPDTLPAPGYRFSDSAYGRLRFVDPPLMLDGGPLTYRSAPVPYGSSEPRWQDPAGLP